MNPFREQRAKALAAGAPAVRSPGRFRSELTAESSHIYIYDIIDPWGGYWGVSAGEVVQALAGVSGAVTVHLNSPGGDVWEAISMTSVLRQHAGMITMRVDGVAASAASMLMTAGNRVEVAPNAEVMIHDPWTVAIGNAMEIQQDVDRLERTAQNVAGMYAAKAGGTPEEWRDKMRPLDTWYIGGQEIIDAGLADALIAENTGGISEQVTQEAAAFANAARAVYASVRSGQNGGLVLPTSNTTTDIPPVGVENLALDWDEIQAALKGLAA